MRCGHLIWGIICYCTTACSFRILKKAGEWRLRRFVFVVIASQIGLKIHRIFETSKDSDKTNPSTETNNTSYESPDTRLFVARRMRAWHHHGGAMPTSRKTVYYFSFWGHFLEKKIIRSNVPISWMHRYHLYDLKVHFWQAIKHLFSNNQRWNTLYLVLIVI